jgi:hypothetical protein
LAARKRFSPFPKLYNRLIKSRILGVLFIWKSFIVNIAVFFITKRNIARFAEQWQIKKSGLKFKSNIVENGNDGFFIRSLNNKAALIHPVLRVMLEKIC